MPHLSYYTSNKSSNYSSLLFPCFSIFEIARELSFTIERAFPQHLCSPEHILSQSLPTHHRPSCFSTSRTCMPQGFIRSPKSNLLFTQQARPSIYAALRRPQPMTNGSWCINILSPSALRREALFPRVFS